MAVVGTRVVVVAVACSGGGGGGGEDFSSGEVAVVVAVAREVAMEGWWPAGAVTRVRAVAVKWQWRSIGGS